MRVTQNTLAMQWICGHFQQEEAPITFLLAAVMTSLDMKNKIPFKIKSQSQKRKEKQLVQDVDNAQELLQAINWPFTWKKTCSYVK